MTRYFTALFGSIVITLGLFGLMQYMILNNQQGLKRQDKNTIMEFVRLKRDTQIEKKHRKHPEPPPPPEKKPPPPKMPTTQPNIQQQAVPNVDMPNLDIPMQNRFSGSLLTGVQVGSRTGSIGGLGGAAISTNLIPLVRIPPRYPMRAASRRIEGWVKVEFTITATGTVKDAVVVSAHPENIFDRAALRAIAKWKFKAKIVDGTAVEQRAAQTLQFKLSR